jgi:flagellar basal-body rod protein FlgG
MSDGIYSATSGAISQQRSLEVVANNVANATAVGFRGDHVAFREALARAGAPGAAGAAGSLRYVTVSQVKTDASQGGLRQTGNSLDVALQGDGYFAVQTPRGESYTRAGSFVLDSSGVVRTQDGYALLSAGESNPRQPVTIPSGTGTVEISPDGSVNADGSPVGQLRIVAFDDPSQLVKEGNLLYSAPAGVVAKPAQNTEALQGFVETANVYAVGSVNELITINRSFEAFQRVIRTFGELEDRTARDLGSST